VISRRNDPQIATWGIVTALGDNALHTGLFLRAGKNQVRKSVFIDKWGERITLSFLSTLPWNLAGFDRLARLGGDALKEALLPLGELPHGIVARLALALPEAKGDADSRKAKMLSDWFARSASNYLPVSRISVFPAGHAAGAEALAEAHRWITSGKEHIVIVAGIDSYYDWHELEALEAADRIITEDNLDGMIPGEAAATLVLVSDRLAPLLSIRPAARLLAAGTARDPHPFGSEEVCAAEGYARAAETVLAPVRTMKRRVNYFWTDLTNEGRKTKEFQLTIPRIGDVLGTAVDLMTPLRELGDTRSATIPLMAALSAEAWQKGYGADSISVCMAGSDGGMRGIAVLEVES
jgi:3-oxoacyl-[acyl-carrier-protein] synthase I